MASVLYCKKAMTTVFWSDKMDYMTFHPITKTDYQKKICIARIFI
jgi:hypothetical protein